MIHAAYFANCSIPVSEKADDLAQSTILSELDEIIPVHDVCALSVHHRVVQPAKLMMQRDLVGQEPRTSKPRLELLNVARPLLVPTRLGQLVRVRDGRVEGGVHEVVAVLGRDGGPGVGVLLDCLFAVLLGVDGADDGRAEVSVRPSGWRNNSIRHRCDEKVRGSDEATEWARQLETESK